MAGFSFGTPTTSASSFTLGNTTTPGGSSGFNFGAQPNNPPTTTLQFNASGSTGGLTTLSTPGSTGFNFGASGGLSLGTPTTTQASLAFKPTSLGAGLGFGSPATTQQPAEFSAPAVQTGLNFGSTPASTQQTLSFGNVPATSQPTLSFGNTVASTQPTLSFGSTPATSQPTLGFGNTPAMTQPTLNFGSTAATTQPTLSFGSSAATTQPTLSFGSSAATTQPTLSFGSSAATTQPTLSFASTAATTQPTLSFGSSAATTQPTLSFASSATTTQPTLSFGSSAATTQPTLSFGNTPATTQTGLSFGTTSTSAQPTLNFGLSTPATIATTGLSLGTPATTTAGLSFGLGSNQTATTKPTTTATTSTPSLLNFSTPKTTTSGFSLSVTGAGTNTSLFTLPTTSAPTNSAPVAFKGLGGVDTSATQGSGQKDAKSVKENIVDREIMQTLDTFKNFVKQQKTLSCEVSRAPLKPMHKVTEDTEALRQLLTSVSSALQKNRVLANKLKADTTKCLSLCEMAQRTHDTPPGLQNDNIAPLEFFIQLVSKFERDIQVLRQEIDNTEKHVNSLSYPAILTPQELSVALRRLHDSFVALAGRLQSAHTGVIAQKERHLSLRRHFLKDHTNVFETTARTAATTKKSASGGSNVPPMPGPTPFSSMGGMHNISLMTGPDKPVTFSTGPTSLSGWGSSSMAMLNTTPGTSFMQSPGTSLLSSPQPVENQNFQLSKPPPGNKRGKR